MRLTLGKEIEQVEQLRLYGAPGYILGRFFRGRLILRDGPVPFARVDFEGKCFGRAWVSFCEHKGLVGGLGEDVDAPGEEVCGAGLRA